MKKFAVILTTAMVTVGTVFATLMPATVCAAEVNALVSSPNHIDAVTSATVEDGFYNNMTGYNADDHDSTAANDIKYVGNYACGRANIEIKKIGNKFDVTVDWGNTAYEMVEWKYICYYDNASGSLIADGTGTKTIYDFSANDNGLEKRVYSDGSAEFSLVGNNLIWEDHVENAASQMIFERM